MLQELRQAVELAKINIFLGVHDLEEVLPRRRSSAADSTAKISYILDLTDKEKMIKPPEELVPDEIRSYAFQRPIPSSYIQIHERIAAQFQALRKPDEAKFSEISLIVEETQDQIEEFRTGMKIGKGEVLRVAKGLIAKNLPFNMYFDKLAPGVAEALAERAGVLEECKKNGIKDMLGLKAVGMAVGINLSYTYALTFEGRTPKSGDSRDILHSITATAADIFVSHDKGLRTLIDRIPSVTFKTLDFHGLINTIRKYT